MSIRRKGSKKKLERNWFYRQYYHMLYALNNKKIRIKMMYVYILCVMLPTIVTNFVVISNIIEVAKNEKQETIYNTAESLANVVDSTFKGAVYVSVDLYTSKSVATFLDEKYESPSQYIQAYKSLFDNYVFYASSKHLIKNITLYSDNESMINGGRYYKINEIEDTQWFEDFVNSKQEVFVCAYFNDTIYDNQKKRMLSVIRKLNYQGNRTNDKLVKLDLNYEKVNRDIIGITYDSAVYVCANDKIIFSNDSDIIHEKDEFYPTSYIPMDKVQVHKSITSYNKTWDIYVTGYKTNYYAEVRKNSGAILSLLLADAIIPGLMFGMFSKSITQRVLLLGTYLDKMKNENFEEITEIESKDEIGELINNYNVMTVRMKELIEYEFKSKLEQQELHLARQQAELLALYSQINPHFMYNVLESIRMRSVLKGENETSEMIESLAKLMRRTASWKEDYITLRQELTFAEDYLKLQKYRFGDEFRYKMNIKDECYEIKIPSLSLVTFVENACVHGLNRVGHGGSIFISAYIENNICCIEIEDTGVGIEEEKVKHMEALLNHATIDDLQKSESLGIINTMIRLKKYCSESTQITIESEKQVGTCITITIPMKNDTKC